MALTVYRRLTSSSLHCRCYAQQANQLSAAAAISTICIATQHADAVAHVLPRLLLECSMMLVFEAMIGPASMAMTMHRRFIPIPVLPLCTTCKSA